MIPYLQPGDQLTAARWNDIFAAAETILSGALGSLSAVFAGVDRQWDRSFFFFDPQNPPSTLHPVAASFLAGYLNNRPSNQQVMFWRQYDHAAITSLVGGLSQAANTSKWQVVKLTMPTWATWLAAIYPSGFGSYGTGGMTQTISSVVYPANNAMDVSLAVLTQSVGGTAYSATFKDVTTAEHAQPFKPIDAFVNSDLTWDAAWDKYSLVRVHNCARAAVNATFGAASATIAAGSCKCFRKLATGWIACGTYFHTMQSGDGRFLQMRDAGNSASGQINVGSPIFMPGMVADVIANTLGFNNNLTGATTVSNFSKQADPAKFFDMSAIYNNSARTPVGNEKTPPSGGYFPALANTDLLGDLIVHRGQVLVANRAVPTVIHASMTKTVVMTLAIPAPTYDFTDGTNTVANVSNAAVYNVTTGQNIQAQSDPTDPATANWTVNYTTQQIAIIPRGSQYDPGTGTMIPIVPAPYAPFVSNGDVLLITFDYIPPDDHVWVDFEGFGTLAAKLAAVGLASRAIVQNVQANWGGGTVNNLEIYSAATWHLIDLSSNLVSFLLPSATAALTGSLATLPARKVGVSTSSSDKSLVLPWLLFTCAKVQGTTTPQNLTYKNWNQNSSGAYSVGSTVNVTVNTAGSTLGYNQKIFLPTNAVADVQAWITSALAADGGILAVENFKLHSTVFGPVFCFDEVWPLDAKFTQIESLFNYVPVMPNAITTRITFDAGRIALVVTRAIYLEMAGAVQNNDVYGSYFTRNCGLFPPVRGTAAQFMFWNFPRIDLQFENTRYWQPDAADVPNWIYPGGSRSAGFFNTSGYDELENNEFIHIKRYFEFTPIAPDMVASPASRAKSTIARMGAFSRTADIWSPFSYWLGKITSLTYPTNATGGTASISTSSGWYAANISSVMSNATISEPIPNVLPCQSEHFNSLASLINSQPPMRYQIGKYGGTTFTLDFSAANIIIVNGGSGFTVGQALNFNLKVASVDGSGAITAVAQNGSVVVNSYDAYSTPVRPFALGGNATCDTSSGDGSALSFIPTFSPIGVPVPSGLTGTYWPRGTWFAWNGPTTGGADPVGSYLASLGMTIQSTLPDAYGTAQPVYAYDLQNDGSITNTRITGYGMGMDISFAAKASSYRWITIDSARTLYMALSMPFVLNSIQIPYKFVLENIAGTVTPTVSTSDQSHNYYLYDSNTGGFDPNLNGRNPYYAAPSPWTGPDDTSTKYCDIVPGPIVHIPTANNGGGFLGHVNEVAAGWANDTTGNWVTNYGSQNLGAASSPLAPPAGIYFVWTGSEVNGSSANYGYSLGDGYEAGTFYSAPYDAWNWREIETWTHKDVGYSIAYAQPATILNPLPVTQLNQCLNSVLILAEGMPDQCAACVPKNAAYYDIPWSQANSAVITALGNQVIPIITDNTVELAAADAVVVPGQGGAGKYEHLITTGLLNSRLVITPIDSQTNNNPPPPSGGI